jgi:hypothetical protein
MANNPLANTRSPMGEGLTSLAQMLMQYLSMSQAEKDKEKDRQARATEFATQAGFEKQRVGMEQSRLGLETQQAKNVGAREAVNDQDPFGGALSPELAAKLQEIVKGTPSEGRLVTKPGLTATPTMPGLTDAQGPAGDVTSINPTQTQSMEKARLDAAMEQLKTEKSNAPLLRRVLEGQTTGQEQMAASRANIELQHKFVLQEIAARAGAEKKTSYDDDLSRLSMMFQRSAKAKEDGNDEQVTQIDSVIQAMMGMMQTKYPQFKIPPQVADPTTNPLANVPPPPAKSGVMDFLKGAMPPMPDPTTLWPHAAK